MAIEFRSYGLDSAPPLVVLHGGPGAPGYMAPVARELASSHHVIEPFQRGSGGEPLTVKRHVEDLWQLLGELLPGQRPPLLGSSWGAMLALAAAAAAPERAGPLALVGSGTYDHNARSLFHQTLEERSTDALHAELSQIDESIEDRDERLKALALATLPIYSFELGTPELGLEQVDADAFEQSWSDMLRLQSEGVYPASFQEITTPVLMLHGAHDPHPGELIHRSLSPHIQDLEYREIERCGHYPWLEKHGAEPFYQLVRQWLAP